MFARITPYQLKPGTIAAATERAKSLKDQIMGLPGMIQFFNTVNEDGTGYVVSIVESRETSDGNADRVKAIWGNMAEFLAEMPVPAGYDVIHHWTK